MEKDSQGQNGEPDQQRDKGESRGTTPSLASSKSTPAPRSKSKRSRGLGDVTPNACVECRKKRTKCDGGQPCGRCKTLNDVECIYEIPVRQSKEELRNEIERLRHRQRSTDLILTGINQPNLRQEVLSKLHAQQPVDRISKWIKNAMRQPSAASSSLISTSDEQIPGLSPQDVDMANSFASGVSETPAKSKPWSATNATIDVNLAQQRSSQGNLSAQSMQQRFATGSKTEPLASVSGYETLNQTPLLPEPARSRIAIQAKEHNISHLIDDSAQGRELQEALSTLHDPSLEQVIKHNTNTWTSLTKDPNAVHHLLALYFCWEYPTFATLSKEHFLLDLSQGRERYCSSMLVNALLALGSRFSQLPVTKANPSDKSSSGEHFFKESLRLLRQETDYHSLVVIQTLGILSLREASCGHIAQSVAFSGQSMRLAIEMGLHCIVGDDRVEKTDEFAVQSATFWGAYTLDHAWSLSTGSLPQCSKFPSLPPKPPIVSHMEASLWIPYIDSGVPPQQFSEQKSNVRSVIRCFAELSELVHQTLYLLYSPDGSLSASTLLNTYTKYLEWFDEVPRALRLGHNFTPSVLFCHMYYHFAVLLLFRPMINLHIAGSEVRPREICSQAAHAMHVLLESYAQLYTLEWTPTFLPHFILTSCVTHLAIGVLDSPNPGISKPATLDPQAAKAVKEGMAGLAEMTPCHRFAEQALNILRYLAQEWNLDVDIGAAPVLDSKEYDRFIRPYASTLNFFTNSKLAEELIEKPNTSSGLHKTTSGQVEKAMEMMENLLLRPIPLQGPSILLKEQNLDEGGFVKQ